MKDGDRLIQTMKAEAALIRAGLPELDPSESEIIMWLWLQRN